MDASTLAEAFPALPELRDCTTGVVDLLEEALSLAAAAAAAAGGAAGPEYPAVGACFADLCQTHEFDVYEQYAAQFERAAVVLRELLRRRVVTDALEAAMPRLVLAATHVLPQLLLEPAYHVAHYAEALDALARSLPADQAAEHGQLRHVRAPAPARPHGGPSTVFMPAPLFF